MKKNVLEWSVFGVSLLIVAAVLGTLVFYASEDKQPIPFMEVQTGPALHKGNQWIVPITVHNKSDATAEGVKIEVTLHGVQGEPEQAEGDFLFVPKRSHREGFVVFTSDPAKAKRIEARAVAYEKP